VCSVQGRGLGWRAAAGPAETYGRPLIHRLWHRLLRHGLLRRRSAATSPVEAGLRDAPTTERVSGAQDRSRVAQRRLRTADRRHVVGAAAKWTCEQKTWSVRSFQIGRMPQLPPHLAHDIFLSVRTEDQRGVRNRVLTALPSLLTRSIESIRETCVLVSLHEPAMTSCHEMRPQHISRLLCGAEQRHGRSRPPHPHGSVVPAWCDGRPV
jgi:hypothetical protein